MARTEWTDPRAEKTFTEHDTAFRIKDVHDSRQPASDKDTFKDRWEGAPHHFQGDTTPEDEERASGSYPKKRIM